MGNPKQKTMNECLEIFKKYDTDLYKHYSENAYLFGADARRYADYLEELHRQDDSVYIVVFDTAGYIGSVSVVDKSIAANCSKQLRNGGRKVKQMDRETFLALQEEDRKKRRDNIALCQSEVHNP